MSQISYFKLRFNISLINYILIIIYLRLFNWTHSPVFTYETESCSAFEIRESHDVNGQKRDENLLLFLSLALTLGYWLDSFNGADLINDVAHQTG